MVTAPSSSLVERRLQHRASRSPRGWPSSAASTDGGALAREDHGELLAAVAGGEAGRRLADAADDAGDIAQHLVAGLVAPGVVEALEMVDVDDGQGQRLARLASASAQARRSSSSKALRLARLVRASVMASRRTCSRCSRRRSTSSVEVVEALLEGRRSRAGPCGWRWSGSRPCLAGRPVRRGRPAGSRRRPGSGRRRPGLAGPWRWPRRRCQFAVQHGRRRRGSRSVRRPRAGSRRPASRPCLR